MECPILAMNDELLKEVTIEDQKTEEKEDKKEDKKNSKRYIIRRIFEICEKNNFEIKETETQLLRKTRKVLLQTLAGYVEQSMENKIKSGENGIPSDCQGSDYANNLPMLKLAHGFICSLIEKGFNSTASYLEYSYEIKNYARACNESIIIDQALIDIANEYGDDLFRYFANPYLRLLFVHATSMISCCKFIDKQKMHSPKVNFQELNI